MVNAKNEMKYSMAWQLLRRLLNSHAITESEYASAHEMIIEKYSPLAVHQKP